MNPSSIPFKSPSLRRDDFLSVLEAMINRQIYPGELYQELQKTILEKYNFSNMLLLSSKWVAWKLFLEIEKIRKKKINLLISNNSDPFYYRFFKSEGITVIPVELNKETLLPSIEDIRSKEIPENTYLFISYPYGFPQDVSELISLGIPILADLSGSFSVLENKRVMGIDFEFCVYSLKDEDIITAGDGALLRVKEPKKFLEYYEFVEENNLKLSDYNCALALSQINKIDKIRNSREKLFKHFASFIDDKEYIYFNREYDPLFEQPNYNQFIVRFNHGLSEASLIAEKLQIEIKPVIEKPISLFADVKLPFPVSMELSSKYIKIPFYPTLTQQEIEKISILLKKIV